MGEARVYIFRLCRPLHCPYAPKKQTSRAFRLDVQLAKKSVKSADTPDSVHTGCPVRDRHSSGPGVARPARCHLPASSAGHLNAGLLGVAARRDCPFHPARSRLVSVALILTSRWRAVSSCAALCSPDVPPVRPFGAAACRSRSCSRQRLLRACTSGGLAGFTAVIIRAKPASGPSTQRIPGQPCRAA